MPAPASAQALRRSGAASVRGERARRACAGTKKPAHGNPCAGSAFGRRGAETFGSGLALPLHSLIPAALHALAERFARRPGLAARVAAVQYIFNGHGLGAARHHEGHTAHHDGEADEPQPQLLRSHSTDERTDTYQEHNDAQNERAIVQATPADRTGLHHVGLALIEPSLHLVKQPLLVF